VSPCSASGCGRGSGPRRDRRRRRGRADRRLRHLPYIALVLAASFGSYSLIKKRLVAAAAEGCSSSRRCSRVPALGYLTWLTSPAGAAVRARSAGTPR
jgi:EamA domain-containing membrane protein RarD